MRIVLANPSLLKAPSAESPRSWIQLAKTGTFVSNRYGKFEITKTDLSQMLHNFVHVTPKSPTELPVDVDHLSMDPKKPGDGVAAGWMKRLELRDEGEELWAEVEWTPTWAEKIRNKEYRFVSPSFVKDHTHKDGEKIGTTLLAAAITNHPFLEGMKALTLYNFSALGDLAMMVSGKVVSLAEVGQRVMVAPGEARTQDEVVGTFEVSEMVGDGDDAFIAVKDAQGNIHKWFRATELLPASATPANPAAPALPAGSAVPAVSALPAGPAGPAGPAPLPPAPPGVDPLAAAAAAAMPAAPAAPVVPGKTDPADVASAAADAVVDEVDPAKGDDAEDGATGSDDKKPEPPKKALAIDDKKVDNDGDLREAIKKAVAAALAAAAQTPTPKGFEMKFTLRNDKNEPIEVTAEQLASAGITIVPEGHSAIPTTELTELKDSVKSLSTTVASLQTDSAKAQAMARTIELNSTLDRLVRSGFITPVTRTALFEQFKEAIDLAGFRVVASSFKTPIVNLTKEFGSSGDDGSPAGEIATTNLVNLSNQLVKDRGMSLRDATIEAGKMLAKDAEAYREQFAEV